MYVQYKLLCSHSTIFEGQFMLIIQKKKKKKEKREFQVETNDFLVNIRLN